MNIGIVGMGKLGLPVALAIESKGHKVRGYDINPNVGTYLKDKSIPFKEKDIQPLLDSNHVEMTSLEEVVRNSDIVFCAIQTPHEKRFEGATPLPQDRQDFDYTYLIEAVKSIAYLASDLEKPTTLVVISTCLPGTYNTHIKPLLNEYIDYVYNPFFIAMGQVVDDFLDPEFVLIGKEKQEEGIVEDFYRTIHSKAFMQTDITTAEAVKVSYNTFITMKTVLANTWGELAHKVGANVDDIYKAWTMATDRLISPKYLKAGVGDGGGCHPRDNIALSWLAREVGLSHNIFEDLMEAREDHMAWLASEAVAYASDHNLPIVVLGRSFKPETNIETGSPAILMASILKDRFQVEFQHEEDMTELGRAVYVIGTKHERYNDYEFPIGSVVIDPFRYIDEQPDVKLVSIGSGRIVE